LTVKIKLFDKIFATFLLTSFMVVALLVGFMRFYVARNFTDYVNSAALERLDELKDELADIYRQHQGWQTLKDDPSRWEEILRASIPRQEFRTRRRPSGFSDFKPKTDPQFAPDRQRPTSGERLDRVARGLALFDAHQQPDNNDRKFIDYLNSIVKGNVPFIVVLNKIDLGLNQDTRDHLHGLATQLVEVSAKKGTHIPQLKEKIKQILVSDEAVEAEDIIVSSARHKEVLGKAEKAMRNFSNGIQQGMDEVILASELRSALDYLGEIVGEITSEDLLNHIFGKFCIGK